MDEPFSETNQFGRFVLLGVTDLALRGETPANTHDVKRTCKAFHEETDQPQFGEVTERGVSRCLSDLAARELLTEEVDRSPVGKGRPRYELAASVEAVIEALERDDDVAPLVDRLGENAA